MQGKLHPPIFWALVAVFVVTAVIFLIPAVRELVMGFPFIIISGVVLFLLGIALILAAVREKVEGALKKFLILTGASAAGLFVSVLLHNAVYGLFSLWFGMGFWDRVGLGDEPVFFILAVFLCPLAFSVGAIGSIALIIKRFRVVRKTPVGLH